MQSNMMMIIGAEYHMLKKIKEHGLSILIGSTGWIILIFYLLYEYSEYGSVAAVLADFAETEPLVVLFHFMIVTSPITSTGIAYLTDKRIKLERTLDVTYEKLQQELSQRKKAEEALKKKSYDLGERVKELKGLYGTSQLITDPDNTLEMVFQGTVDLMPPAWQYPEITCAKIVYGDREFKTANWKKTKWMQSSDIITMNERVGKIEVGYLEEKPEIDEGPFLKEERNLIDALARILGDFTERKRAEEVLRESEEKFRNLAEQSPNMIFINKGGRVVYANQKCEELGYTIEEILSKDFDFMGIIVPESRKLVKDNFSKHMKGEEVPPYEYTLITKDKSRIVGIHTTKLIEYRGEQSILGIVTDITERKKAEEALRESEEKFRGIFDESLAAVYVFDEKKNFIDSNQAGLELLGYTRKELLSMSIPDVDADPIVVMPAHEKLLAGERIINYEHKLRRKDGKVITVLNNSRPLVNDDGQVFGMQSILIDITERKRVEEALRESEERFRKIFEEGPLGMIITGLDFRFVNVNPTLSRMLGYTEQELLKLSFPDITPPDDVGQDVENAKKLMRGEIPIYRTEKRYIRKDKHVLWINLTATLIRSEDKKPQYFLTMVEDITARKRAEEALGESEARFRHLSEAAFEAIVTHDKGLVLEANDQFYAMFGYRADELLGKQTIIKIVAPEAREFMKKQIEIGALGPYESIGVRKDGTRFPMEIRVRESEFKGRPVRVGAIMDITERKKAEEALRESEEKYRGLYNSIRDAILVADTNRNIIDCNAAFTSLFGHTLDDIKGKQTVYVYENEEDFNALGKALKKHYGEGPFLKTVNYKKKTGEVFPGETSIFYLTDNTGEVTGFIGLIRDITERKEVEEALQESEEKYRNLVNQNKDAIFIGSLENNVTFASPACEAIFGYTPEEFMNTPEVAAKIVHPSCQKQMIEFWTNYAKTKVFPEKPMEWVWIHKDGRTVHTENTHTNIYDRDGNVIGFQTVARDITERKKAEERINELNRDLELKVRERTAEVEEQKERLTAANEELTLMNEELIATRDELHELNRTLEKKVEERTAQWRLSEKVSTSLGRVIEESLNEIFVFDSETLKFINVNRGARENLGYTMEELKNLTPLDLKPEFTQEQFNEFIRPLRTGEKEKIVFNTVHKRKDGSLYDVEVHLQHSTFGNQSAFIAVILDTTERKKAEEDVVALSRFPEENPYPVLRIAKDGTVLYSNEAGLSMLKHFGSAVGKPIKGDLKDSVFIAYETGKNELIEVEYDNKVFSVDIVLGADLDYVNVYGLEITERRKAEEELAKHRYHLEELVQERTKELKDVSDSLRNMHEDVKQANKTLEDANLKLLEADRLKSVFLASMSHELRTPLNSIIGFTGIILQGMSGELNPEQKKQIEIVYSNSKHLHSLIEDLLDVSKIESGKAEIEPEEFPIADVVGEVIGSLRPEIERKGLTLKLSVGKTVVETDRRYFKQIIMNLAGNAVKYTSSGSIEIAASTHGKSVVVSVSDTGRGVKKDDMPRLFQPFQTLGRRSKSSGTGLGLYLSKRISERLGGELNGKSEYHKGSVFSLRLPRHSGK